MKLIIIIITLLSIFFSALLPTCSSSQIHLQPLLHYEGSVNVHQQLSLPTLPRKLRLTEKVDESGEANKDLASHKLKDSLPAGKKSDRKQNMVLSNKGTRQEWIEGDDTSKYFTMDYHGVRRRRPIHNKHLPPVAP